MKDLNQQAESVLKKHLAIGTPKGQVGLIGTTPYKRFTSMRSFKDTSSTLGRIAERLGVSQLRDITPEMAQSYLASRKDTERRSNILHGEYDRKNTKLVGQKTLDAERKALSILLGSNMARIYTSSKTASKPRAYTNEQVAAVQGNQSSRNALSTRIAWEAGLRAKELLTIRRADEAKITSNRSWHKDRFAGMDGEKYVVIGKGGLVREVRLSKELAAELEKHRRPEPVVVTDRKVKYNTFYDIAGGNAFSKSFSDASKRSLGFSHGAHGLRHQYVQSRITTLKQMGYNELEAKRIVSQEVGHFRASITQVYMR